MVKTGKYFGDFNFAVHDLLRKLDDAEISHFTV